MKRKQKIMFWIIGIIVVCTLVGCTIYYRYQFIHKKISPVVEKKSKDKNDDKTLKDKYVNELPNIRNQYNNPNIMGKLEIPSLNINTLVTRYNNNDYYLYYNIYNQRDEIGVPFFDYRNTELNNNSQINIYGHNTTNPNIIDQLPFTKLQSYTDENTFHNNKDVYLSIDEEQIEYKVIAIKIIEGSDNEHMKLNFYNDEDFLQHVSKLLQRTTYKDSTLEITSNDKLLVLQVCNYNPPDTYLLIICKRIS